jgi:hypothetical protein
MKTIIEKLRVALIKDFENLYVQEFTSDWRAQRLIRNLEIGVMSFEHTVKLLKDKPGEIGVMIDNYADLED